MTNGPMKAITLRQPWASLVALGVKAIETRSWSTRYRGPLAIHAAARQPIERGEDGPLSCGTVGGFDYVRYDGQVDCPWPHNPETVLHPGDWYLYPIPPGHGPVPDVTVMPLGTVIATAQLVDVVPIVDYRSERRNDRKRVEQITNTLWLRSPDGSAAVEMADQHPYGDFTPGRYAWILDDIQPLAVPVPATGRQQLWTWTP